MQQFSPHGDDFARAFNRFLKLAEHNGFCQEVVRAVLHRIHSHINFTVSGDQDDRRAEGHPRGFVQQIGAVSIRQLNIQQNDICVAALQARAAFRQRGRAFDLVSFGCQELPNIFARIFLIVNY